MTKGSPPSPYHTFEALQQTAGNRAVAQLLTDGKPTEAKEPSWRLTAQPWFFDGAQHDGGETPTKVDVEGSGEPDAALNWSVVEGHDKVALGSGDAPETKASTKGTEALPLRTTGGSRGTDDVKLRVDQVLGDGRPGGSYEGNFGVRTPATALSLGSTTRSVKVNSPVNQPAAQDGDQSQQAGMEALPDDSAQSQAPAAADTTNDQAPAPQNAPKSLDYQGGVTNAHNVYAYETQESYKVLDDAGKEMTGFDVNEKFTTDPIADAAGCDWRRGPEGGSHSNGSTFFDRMQGESSSHNPKPLAPGSPGGDTKVQHWSQEWRIGSKTIGEGTLVQKNTFQKYRGSAAHENTQSPPT